MNVSFHNRCRVLGATLALVTALTAMAKDEPLPPADADEAVLTMEEKALEMNQAFTNLPAAFTRRLAARRLDSALAKMPAIPAISEAKLQTLRDAVKRVDDAEKAPAPAPATAPATTTQATTPAAAAVGMPKATIFVKTPAVARGERIVATYEAGSSPKKSAWIAIYSNRQSAATQYLSYTFLNNLDNSTYDVVAPNDPGRYHFRLFLDEGYTPAAVSEDVEVR